MAGIRQRSAAHGYPEAGTGDKANMQISMGDFGSKHAVGAGGADMTANNTWPDPARPGVPINPEQDGWHWLQDSEGNKECVSWRERKFLGNGRGLWSFVGYEDDFQPHEIRDWTYLGPVLTPDEATALQARADRNAAGFARVDAEAERAKFLHKQKITALQKRCEEAERTALQAAECHARETRRADALQKRVAELEGALKEAAASVGEWGAYASQYLQDKWDLPGEVARYIAIAEGKNDAALTGGENE